MRQTKSVFLKISLFLTLVLITQACSTSNEVVSKNFIQKRKYNRGWHISSSKNGNAIDLARNKPDFIQRTTKNKLSIFEETTKVVSKKIINSEILSSKVRLNKIVQKEHIKINTNSFKNHTIKDNIECDIIVLKNGNEIQAKVIEVGTTELKYKMCDNLDGPIFSKSISDISVLKYPNGTKTVFDEEAEKDISDLNEDDYIDTFGGNDKSFIIAILLWFFIGIIGIHRFYLGHYAIGILYLLTFGLCGFGWLIDGMLFLTDNLKPKRGKYIDI
ncbi:MAG: TM2 domain-containing protein [Crocinitomicaceae bacterium]